MLKIFIRRNFSTVSKKLTDVFLVLGGPGSGKGTQCDIIAKKYNMGHLSAGELLREEMKKDTPESKIIDVCIKEGKIVPNKYKSQITVRLLLNKMKEDPDRKYFIDGFPRNQENLGSWEEASKDKTNLLATLCFECSLNAMTERIKQRAVSSGRTDDNMESLKKRFKIFEEETRPVLNYYAQKGKLITINGEKSVQEVTAELEEKIKKFL